MAISIITNFNVNAPAPIDSKMGPYATTAEALTSISSLYRYKGLTVIITGSGASVEYWFNPTTADSDLILKQTSAFPYTGSAEITGSLFVIGNTTLTGSLFKFIGDTEITGSFKVFTGSNVQPAMQINSEGVFMIGQYTTTPTPVEGGLIYSGSDYFLGFQ